MRQYEGSRYMAGNLLQSHSSPEVPVTLQSVQVHYPFTPKSDQCQIPLAASPEILHCTVSQDLAFHSLLMKDEYATNFSLSHSYIYLIKVGRMYFLNLGVKGLTLPHVQKVHSPNLFKEKRIIDRYNHLPSE